MNLDNLDTLIGFTVVILLLSLLVTTMVQLAGALLGLRGRNLLWGVKRVLKEVGVEETELGSVAGKILGHDSIRPNVLARFPNFLSRHASAIHFNEFWAILQKLPDARAVLDKGAGRPPLDLTGVPLVVRQAVEEKIAALSVLAAQAQAQVTDASTRARFWFDSVMDRTTERFVLHTRVVTVFVAAALAFGAQIDSLAIIKQLSQRPDVRARLVAMADPVSKQAEALVKPAVAANPAPGETPAAPGEADKAKVDHLLAQLGSIQKDLAQTSLQLLPTPFTYDGYCSRLFGMFMTALFLSLGAPFWFNTLRQLANLRPILAKKVDDKDRAQKG